MRCLPRLRHSAVVILAIGLIAPAVWFSLKSVVLFRSAEDDLILDASLPRQDSESAAFVGRQSCVSCHQEQAALWSGSHHDLAMQVATEQTVLGNFDDVEFSHFGVPSRFYKRDDTFMVRTDGPDGKLHEYAIAYTFGVDPLQQYLIAFPDGRLQALGIAWDSRPASAGGQRWFHLYPNEDIPPDDILHWTGQNQTWNFMCAECHSTHVRKNYDLESDRYLTTWSEIDVSCEACHGPGSTHVAWATHNSGGDHSASDTQKGLLVHLNAGAGARWEMQSGSGTARRLPPLNSHIEVESCARCHARRVQLWEDYAYGRPLMQTHLPRLLDEGLYHADGQIQAEVYVYGSFLQSKMYHAGVTCSDCHEPHSLQLRVPGDGVCGQCHQPKEYDSPTHHFHQAGSPGASCVACHMPATTYMEVDPRHDHSFRIPRPDLSVKIDTPNACSPCHTDRPAEWAAEHVRAWYGAAGNGYQDFAEILHAARNGTPVAERLLVQLAQDESAPAIARATALSQLQRYVSPVSFNVVRSSLKNADPLIRAAAVGVFESVAPEERLSLLLPLLEDPMRSVRIQAARLLASVPTGQLTSDQSALLERTLGEYMAVQQTSADRPEAHVNLGSVYAERGQFQKAETAYRTALRLQPAFIPAAVNLADLFRRQGKERQAERILRQALTVTPPNADIQHALGLSLVRQKRRDEAVDALAQAARLAPDQPRYSYVYAVALHSAGRPEEAKSILESSHTRSPAHREILAALITFNRENGNLDTANRYAEKLLALSPHDPTTQPVRE